MPNRQYQCEEDKLRTEDPEGYAMTLRSATKCCNFIAQAPIVNIDNGLTKDVLEMIGDIHLVLTSTPEFKKLKEEKIVKEKEMEEAAKEIKEYNSFSLVSRDGRFFSL